MFVNAPWTDCPECGTKGSFGVLMISEHQFTKRCVNCWLDEKHPLPEIRKKIIYLDQFVISNITKELDPDRPKHSQSPHSRFFLQLFEKLDRLSKLQLVVMPYSSVQENESAVDPNYKKFRAVFRQLSHGVSFNDPQRILYSQILDEFYRWQNKEPLDQPHHFSSYFSKDPHVWQERFRIDLNFTYEGIASELRQNKILTKSKLKEVVDGWRADTSFKFEKIFENELLGNGALILESYEAHIQKWIFCRLNKTEPSQDLLFSSPTVDLARRLLEELSEAYPDLERRFLALREFFVSEPFRKTPSARIASYFWATLARHVRTVTSEKKLGRFYEAGLFNDIDVVSNYALHCDAMFIDNDMAHLARQPELAKELEGKARLFSLNTKDDFLAYLDDIEASAPASHLQKVEEVYGEKWAVAFVDLLSILKKRST